MMVAKDSVQSRIAWQTINEVSRRNSTTKAKLKATNQQEQIKLWKQHFENGNPCATIISWYSSTNVSEETELIAFYDGLSSLVRSIPKHNVLVIGGDMNAQIGKKRKPQIQLTQLVRQKWTTSNRFHDRK